MARSVTRSLENKSIGRQKSRIELQQKLNIQLEKDILWLLQTSSLCDLELIVDEQSLFSHSCILKTRAARFFAFITTEFLVSQKTLVTAIVVENASIAYIKKFLENIYSPNCNPEAESYILKYLECVKKDAWRGFEKCKKSQRSIPNLLSPQSETFYTPKASPSELYKPFSLLSTSEEEISLSRNKNNESVLSYYRIVSLDDFNADERKVDKCLDKELAEQDELFESLRCINSKKESQKKIATPFAKKNCKVASKEVKNSVKRLPWRQKLIERGSFIGKKGLLHDEIKLKNLNLAHEISGSFGDSSSDTDLSVAYPDSGVDLNISIQMETSLKDNSYSHTSGLDLTDGAINEIPTDGCGDGILTNNDSEKQLRDPSFAEKPIDAVHSAPRLEEDELARLDAMERNMKECEIFLDMERRAHEKDFCNIIDTECDVVKFTTTDELAKSVDFGFVSTANQHSENIDSVSSKEGLEKESMRCDDYSQNLQDIPCANTPPSSPMVKHIDSLNETKTDDNVWKAPSSTHFFIDASSLLDETEYISPPMSLPAMKSNSITVMDESSHQSLPVDQLNGNDVNLSSRSLSSSAELERQQGELIFRNSIPHYSRHELDTSSFDFGDCHDRCPSSFVDSGCHDLKRDTEENDGPEQVVPVSNTDDLHYDDAVYDENIAQSLPHEFDVLEASRRTHGFSPEKALPSTSLPADSYMPSTTQHVERPRVVSKCIDTPVRKISAECMPIVSGGASPKDFSSPPSHTSSPHLRRRNEMAPIISGGLNIVESEEEKPQRRRQPAGEVWVVDICSGRKGKSNTNCKEPEMSGGSKERGRQKKADKIPGLLSVEDDEDMNCETEGSNTSASEAGQSAQSYPVGKSASLGFFIEFEQENDKTPPQHPKRHRNDSSGLKKNMFSMFIDINSEETSESCTKKSSRDEVPPLEAQADEKITKEVDSHEKKPFYMFIDSESPVVKRKSFPSSKLQYSRSTSEEPAVQTRVSAFDHSSRSDLSDVSLSSLTSVESKTMASLDNKINNRPQSIWSDGNSGNSSLESWTKCNDVQITYSSKLEPDISLRKGSTFIIENAEESSKKTRDLHSVVESTPPKSPKAEEGDSGVVATEESDDSFVRLSDMDTAGKNPYISKPSKKTNSQMTQSIPEVMWPERKPSKIPEREKIMSKSIGSSGGKTAGLDNSFPSDWGVSKSLSRLFPNLSTSMFTLGRRSNNNQQDSDATELSSMLSSVDPSGLEISTSETDVSCHGEGPSKLGQDLLRMFLDEISPDVVVEVGGRRIRAHKCILSSRCQYFAAMLSGGWVESAGNVISLQGYSYSVVHFALCHIYSGESEIPESLNIIELATLADMLCLEGLKEVIAYTLRVKYCHSFHPPCSVCSVSVLDCLPVAAAYGLDDIYRKCLRWITKFFAKIWPTKTFASLPKELLDKCFQYHIIHMTVDNVLDTLLSIDKIRGSLPSIRWAETVLKLVNKLQDASIKFLADHFSTVLTSDQFLALGKEAEWSIERIERSLVEATGKLPAEEACWSHARLHSILSVVTSHDPPPEMLWNENFIMLLSTLSDLVQASLIRQAPRAARSKAWQQMEPELRNRIQEAACLILPNNADLTPRKSTQKDVPSPLYSARNSNRASDLRQVKLVMAQQASRTGALTRRQNQISEVRRPIETRPVIPPARRNDVRKSFSTSAVRDSLKPSKGVAPRFNEVKSRYLEPKSPQKVAPARATTVARRDNQRVSSSDSSRNCSPGMARAATARSQQQADAKHNRNFNRTVSSCSNRSETPSSRAFSQLKSEENISTDSLATESSCCEKDALRKGRGKENIVNKRISALPVEKTTPHQPRKTQSLSSFPGTGKPKTMIPRMKVVDVKSPLPRRVQQNVGARAQPAKSSMASPRPTTRPNQRTSNKSNVNALNGNDVGKKNIVDSENNSTTQPIKHPAIVSRSGTFLKDEPTILKKPADDV